jgi:molecular chaperone DnaK (HSP70)
MPRAIGIDLGTTNSCVSVMEGDEPVVLTERQGRPHPVRSLARTSTIRSSPIVWAANCLTFLTRDTCTEASG